MNNSTNQPQNESNDIDVDLVIQSKKARSFWRNIAFKIELLKHRLAFKIAVVKSKFKHI